MTSVSGEPPTAEPLNERTPAGPPSATAPAPTARPASRTGRHGQEVAATGSGRELARLRARAERAEAALADHKREAARAIRGLQAEVAFWRLRATGVPTAEATGKAGLDQVQTE